MISSLAPNPTALSLISLYEISKMLSSSLDLERTLLDILNLLASYLQMRRGTIAVKGDDGKLSVIAAAGLTPEALRNGAYFPWDFQPLQKASERYMRNHMDLNVLEDSKRFPRGE